MTVCYSLPQHYRMCYYSDNCSKDEIFNVFIASNLFFHAEIWKSKERKSMEKSAQSVLCLVIFSVVNSSIWIYRAMHCRVIGKKACLFELQLQIPFFFHFSPSCIQELYMKICLFFCSFSRSIWLCSPPFNYQVFVPIPIHHSPSLLIFLEKQNDIAWWWFWSTIK